MCVVTVLSVLLLSIIIINYYYYYGLNVVVVVVVAAAAASVVVISKFHTGWWPGHNFLCVGDRFQWSPFWITRFNVFSIPLRFFKYFFTWKRTYKHL